MEETIHIFPSDAFKTYALISSVALGCVIPIHMNLFSGYISLHIPS